MDLCFSGGGMATEYFNQQTSFYFCKPFSKLPTKYNPTGQWADC